jgi:predicted enzyme related to lactoylglutathione lyase
MFNQGGISMIPLDRAGRFCWLDLAAVDCRQAADFYNGMFGWKTKRQHANGGAYHHFVDRGESTASMYQLGSEQLGGGVPSHWTPYIAVADLEKSVLNASKLGGQVIVEPFKVQDAARVSLITDSVGALVGLWELSQ